MLDILIRKAQSSHGARGPTFEKCKLELKYLSSRNNLSTNPDFETGMEKSQGGSEQAMTQAEKHGWHAF
jgi:hypothetical protein